MFVNLGELVDLLNQLLMSGEFASRAVQLDAVPESGACPHLPCVEVDDPGFQVRGLVHVLSDFWNRPRSVWFRVLRGDRVGRCALDQTWWFVELRLAPGLRPAFLGRWFFLYRSNHGLHFCDAL
ncbi:MAG: hypothetical protein CBC35_10875 [Planctomycetes bacterium TMED75]|nr:hypothetical protein [Planctomycetaceae bacterium]OUU90755.1 MAG: hypothetical protein CBC35_10875 [Planctomycetes bacterium TMED75]